MDTVGKKEPVNGFTRSHKAWYAESAGIKEPEINFGLYFEDGSCMGEARIKWEYLNSDMWPKLEMWEDSWLLIGAMPELFLGLADLNGTNPTEAKITELFLESGFEDLTKYDRPLPLNDGKPKNTFKLFYTGLVSAPWSVGVLQEGKVVEEIHTINEQPGDARDDYDRLVKLLTEKYHISNE